MSAASGPAPDPGYTAFADPRSSLPLEPPPMPPLRLFPAVVALAALFTLGAGLLLSPLAVFFSDTVELIGVLLTAVMYMTPVIYPKEIVPEKYLWLVRFNPLRSILEVFRDPIHQGEIPPLSHLTVCVAIAVLAFVIGAFAFHRSSDRIAFYI